ncbi:MAG: glycosyltransferase family 1 protein [bacterium]
MKIGIDARFAGPMAKGLGRYTQRLIANLIEIDKNNEYVLFLNKENFNLFAESQRIKKVQANFRWYTLTEQIKLPRLLKKEKLDLVHFPHFNVPILYKQPFVVTLHDLIITHFPSRRATTLGPFFYFFKQLAYRYVTRSAVKRAKKVITVSNYSKAEIVKHFKIPDTKIAVTYEAADKKCLQVNEEFISKTLNKFGIKKDYILYVGNAHPHKNLDRLIEAFKIICKKRNDLKLVLVGKKDYFYSRLEEESIKNHSADFMKNVKFPGFVTDRELAALYRQASLYVFPSLYEGFGLPPIEAMTCGIPVISANTSCLPEILGEAADYFDPYKTEEMAQKIIDLIDDEEKKCDLINKGFSLIKKYSWHNLAEKTLDIYEKAK